MCKFYRIQFSQDLDDTVQIVEKNPAKFRIDSSELQVRKAFIQQTRDEVNHMKERVSTGSSGGTNTNNRINIEVRGSIIYFKQLFSLTINSFDIFQSHVTFFILQSSLDSVPLAASPSFQSSSSYNQLQTGISNSSSTQLGIKTSNTIMM